MGIKLRSYFAMSDAGEAAAAVEKKTARVVTAPASADNDAAVHEETPVAAHKLTECVEFDGDVEVRLAQVACIDESNVLTHDPVCAQDLYYVGTSGVKVTAIDGLENMPKLEVRVPFISS